MPLSELFPPKRNLNVLTDSEYCVRLFLDNPVKWSCNYVLIRCIRRELGLLVKLSDDKLSIGWTKAYSAVTTPEALNNTAADRLFSRRECSG